MSSKRKSNNAEWTKLFKVASAFLTGGFLTYYCMKQQQQQKQANLNSSITAKKPKPIRIYLDGCWDVMHSGHYNAIRQAKALGDYLVVGVHSDSEIALNKRQPIMNNKERLAAVRACKWVDQIEFGAPYSPTLKLLNDLNCDFCAHGDDIPTAANGKSAYDEVQFRLKIFRRTPGVSTTHLIERLLRATEPEPIPIPVSMPETKIETDSMQTGNELVVDLTNINAKYEKKVGGESEVDDTSWSSFLASSTRISAFSNHQIPKTDDVVVYIDGVFDLFHIGHISALKAAKAMGTFLYVGLYDDSIIHARKGKNFPLMGIQERVLNVLSCKYVDEVLIGSPWNINENIIKSLNISYVVITNNTKFAENEMNRYAYAEKQGILKEIKTENSFTTNDLMIRIKQYQHKIKVQNQSRLVKAKKYEQEKIYVEETS